MPAPESSAGVDETPLSSDSRVRDRLLNAIPFLLVSSGSIFSRICSFAALVIAARMLEIDSFGFYALAVALSIGVANTATIGAGDMVAGAAVRNPASLSRYVAWAAAVATISFGIGVVALGLAHQTSATLIGFAGLLVATAINMICMQIVLGASGPAVAAAIGYYAPSLARLGIVLVPAQYSDLPGLSLFTGVLASLSAILAATVARLSLRQAGGQIVGHASSNLLVALILGLTWLVLNQCDISMIAFLLGVDEAGRFTPVVRLFEALGAFAIAAKFVSARDTFSGYDTFLRTIRITIALYIPASVAILFLGPAVARYMLGADLYWSYTTAAVLALAYLSLSVASVALQQRVANGEWRVVRLSSITAIASLLVLSAILTGLFGTLGSAIADLVIYTGWAAWLCTKLTVRNEERCDS